MTHFSPGSYRYRPTQTTPIRNVFMAGDWCKGIPHGANGLSQERAYVTGLRAATLVTGELGVGQAAEVKDVEEDEPHIKVRTDGCALALSSATSSSSLSMDATLPLLALWLRWTPQSFAQIAKDVNSQVKALLESAGILPSPFLF